jgi:hypothetical protein
MATNSDDEKLRKAIQLLQRAIGECDKVLAEDKRATRKAGQDNDPSNPN